METIPNTIKIYVFMRGRKLIMEGMTFCELPLPDDPIVPEGVTVTVLPPILALKKFPVGPDPAP
jgi:hypothetical protein